MDTIRFYDVDYRIDHEAKTAMAPWIVKLAEDAYAGLERRGKFKPEKDLSDIAPVEYCQASGSIPIKAPSDFRLLWDRILNWILFR